MLDGQIIAVFNNKDFDTLKLLYKLYSPIKDEGLKPIANEFKFYLIQSGKAIITNASQQCEAAGEKESSIKFVLNNSGIIEKLLEMHVYYKEMVEQCFGKDPLFTRQLQLAFQEFVNNDIGKHPMAELFANYTDKLMKKGGMKLDADSQKDVLDNVISLFSYLIDKDLFLMVHRN